MWITYFKSAAGADSTALTLTFCVWELLRNPEILKTLQQEIDSCDGIPGVVELESLKYLDAVLKESMRFHSAVMGYMPRVSPPGGAMVEGVYLPEGV